MSSIRHDEICKITANQERLNAFCNFDNKVPHLPTYEQCDVGELRLKLCEDPRRVCGDACDPGQATNNLVPIYFNGQGMPTLEFYQQADATDVYGACGLCVFGVVC